MNKYNQKKSTLQALVGNTPLVRVFSKETGCCELYLKLEYCNPGGSIKDRIAFEMVEAAEDAGAIKPGDTLVEATAGNTGIALAQVAISKGYYLTLVIPDKMSREKIDHLCALGVEIILTRSDVKKGHPDYYQDKAAYLAKTRDNAFYISQFTNPNNPKAHEKTTGPEIWEQMKKQVDAIVLGAGTGGHLTGLTRYFSRVSPETAMVLADPKGSILADAVNKGQWGESSSWLIEGIGEDYIPKTCDISAVKEVITVTDAESFAAARLLLREEGLFTGSSTGAVLHAALVYCQRQKTPKRVVTFAYDSGNKYLSKFYNNEWMKDHGFY